MKNLINIAIQVLPESNKKEKYEMVDEAIKVIDKSGFKYTVCPFETVVECSLDEALDLVKKIHETLNVFGTAKMMTYLKIQTDFSKDVYIEDKMEKYNK